MFTQRHNEGLLGKRGHSDFVFPVCSGAVGPAPDGVIQGPTPVVSVPVKEMPGESRANTPVGPDLPSCVVAETSAVPGGDGEGGLSEPAMGV